MKLIVEITFKDDKVKKYTCTDFPAYASDFLTMYLEGFAREMICTETILNIKQYFK